MKQFIYATLLSAILILGCSAADIRYPNATDPCIMIDMNSNITLKFIGNDGSSLKSESVLDEGSEATGECAIPNGGSSNVDFIISSGVKGTMHFQFTKSADSKVKMDIGLTFNGDSIFKNGDNTPITIPDGGSINMGPDTKSYTCSGQRNLTFAAVNTTKGQYELTMSVSSMHIQGFNVENNTFSEAIDCSAIDQTTVAPAKSSEAPTTEPAPVTTQNATTPSPSNDTSTEGPTTQPSVTTNHAGTSTSLAPTTPAMPTPAPGSPVVNTYSAKGVNGTCILMKAGIEFVVPYIGKDGNKTKTLGINGLNTNETKFSGDCNGKNQTQTLTVTFYETSSMVMTFAMAKDNYYLSKVDLSIDLQKELFPDAKTPGIVSDSQSFTSEFEASTTGSYKCNDNTKLTLNKGFQMSLMNLQYAAFQKNITEFSSSGITECPADDNTNSVVPIAVGAALAALVVIVLIAYLIGRRRSRQSGYEQV